MQKSHLPPNNMSSPGLDFTKVAHALGLGNDPVDIGLDHSLVVVFSLQRSLNVVEVEVHPPKIKTLWQLSVSS